jgi:hypothetical protein
MVGEDGWWHKGGSQGGSVLVQQWRLVMAGEGDKGGGGRGGESPIFTEFWDPPCERLYVVRVPGGGFLQWPCQHLCVSIRKVHVARNPYK